MKTREANWQPQFMTCEGIRTGDRKMWKEEVRNKLQENLRENQDNRRKRKREEES